MKVQWSNRAVRHLISIEAYIVKDRPVAGARVVAKIVESASRLAEFPRLGRIGRFEGDHRSGLPYIVLYRVLEEAINIASVIHTSRKWPEKL